MAHNPSFWALVFRADAGQSSLNSRFALGGVWLSEVEADEAMKIGLVRRPDYELLILTFDLTAGWKVVDARWPDDTGPTDSEASQYLRLLHRAMIWALHVWSGHVLADYRVGWTHHAVDFGLVEISPDKLAGR